ncbi:MAG: hypothetical protein E3J78_03275, partial [Candidatus Cloacimonadota bacterium]
MIRSIRIHNIKIGGKANPFFIISGPCVIENENVIMKTASAIKKIANKLSIPFIFKSSFKKDNRGKVTSYQGPGLKKGLKMLEKVRNEFDIPILSDVHIKREFMSLSSSFQQRRKE